jgi:Na+/phosphate symporter
VTTLRFQKEQSNSKKFEDAHLRIKLATGIKDIPLFVEKFLTREKTYREMLLSVKEKEAELNVYKDKIDKMQKEIEKFSSGHTEVKLSKLHKELRENLVKKAQITQVYDKVAKWILRIKNKLVVNETDNIFSTQSVTENRDTLRESFDDLKGVVIGMLKGMDKGKYREEINKKEKLKEIIEEIPEVDRGKRRFLSNFDETELVGLETDLVLEEIMKKGKKNN